MDGRTYAGPGASIQSSAITSSIEAGPPAIAALPAAGNSSLPGRRLPVPGRRSSLGVARAISAREPPVSSREPPVSSREQPVLAGGRRKSALPRRALGDADAQHLVGRISRYLGIGLQNIVAFYAPDCVVIGGGVAEHFDLLEPAMRTALNQIGGNQPYGGTALRGSRLGDVAGILGGAYMAVCVTVKAPL